jgi:pimeloyl-ACP methyl ester carboxylesterase
VHRTTGDDPKIAYTLYEPGVPSSSDLTLLLLHGAAHDEHCWQYHWTPYLAQHGWRCLTLSYRAHGESAWSRSVQEASLEDDVADVNTVLEILGLESRHVIPVGHSLGGAIAQRLAAQQDVAGLVIISSLALGRWMLEVLPKMPGQFVKHPLVYPKLLKDPSAFFTTPALVREFLLGQDTSEQIVRWYLETCWCHESGKAMQGMLQARPQPLRTNQILFLAGRADKSVSLRSIRASAARLHAPLLELDAPHDLMLAGDWQRAADAVRAFAQQCQEGLALQKGTAS